VIRSHCNLFRMTKSKKKVVVAAVSVRAGRRRRKRGSGGGVPRGLMSRADSRMRTLTLDYFRSLVNPFENSGVRLGWGCMVPSTMVSSVLRSTYSTNSGDGTFSAALISSATNPLWINGGSATSTTWAQQGTSNQTAIQNSCSEGRVVSMG